MLEAHLAAQEEGWMGPLSRHVARAFAIATLKLNATIDRCVWILWRSLAAAARAEQVGLACTLHSIPLYSTLYTLLQATVLCYTVLYCTVLDWTMVH